MCVSVYLSVFGTKTLQQNSSIVISIERHQCFDNTQIIGYVAVWIGLHRGWNASDGLEIQT